MTSLAKSLFLCLCLLAWQRTPVCGQVVITEFLASNSTGLADENGDRSDWIELYNSGPLAVDLDGWHLTDDRDDLVKWTFPAVSISSGGYLLVFASDKDRAPLAGELHANFKLAVKSGYLGLVQSNGTTIIHLNT